VEGPKGWADRGGNVGAVGLWEVVVPVVSVVVTGGVAVWSKIIDARSRQEDRLNARAIDYEGRVWQAKNDALRGLITACRYVKSEAQRKRWYTHDDELHHLDQRALTVRAVHRFKARIGGEDGISEITALAAQPVRDALDEMLALSNAQLQKHLLHLSILDRLDPRVEAAQKQISGDHSDGIDALNDLHELGVLVSRQETALETIAQTADIDIESVIKLCDRTIDVARQDLQGRY
jgi:hypothetical protein